jgi:hypothetical protein
MKRGAGAIGDEVASLADQVNHEHDGVTA